MLTDAEIVAGLGDSLPVGVWIARAPGGEFVYANSKFREIMGLPGLADVARGQYAKPYEIHRRDGSFYPEDRMPFVRALAERRTVMVDDLVIHRRDNEKVSVRAYAHPVFAGEDISHVVIAFFDISREAAAERARLESEERLQHTERMESLGNLAGGVAHDFNNLLGAIKLIASALRLEEKDPDRRAQLETIEEVTETATGLAQALLTFAGRGKNLAAPASVNQAVRSVHRIFSHGLDKRLEVQLQLRSERKVLGDHARLEQLVMNLVLNARDAMPEGGRLLVRTSDDDEDVLLEVLDEGPGVPDALRARIFEPFFTTKEALGRASSGLGLATVYGIVESHGGRIEVADAPGGGALFRVWLPATSGAVEPETSDRPATVRGRGVILVVDDEPVLRQAAIQVLRMLGYDAFGAKDGLEAVALFKERHTEIAGVLLDMSMPGLDGRGTYIALRRIQPEVRVLLTTGYALNEEAQAILDLGVRGFIEKPWNVEQLSSALADVLA